MNWIKVTEALLAEQPDWLYKPLWVSRDGVVESGRYEWREGRFPDRLVCINCDLHALECHITPMVKPAPPIQGETT